MADALEITQLIDKHIKKTISKTEKARLDAWAQESDANRLFMANHANIESVRRDVLKIWKMNEARMDQTMEKMLGQTIDYIPKQSTLESIRRITAQSIPLRIRRAVVLTATTAAAILLILTLPKLLSRRVTFAFASRSATISNLLSAMNQTVTSPTFSYLDTALKEKSRPIYDSLPEEQLVQIGNYMITKRDKRFLAVVLIERPVFDNSRKDSVISTLFIPPDLDSWQVLLPDSSKVILEPGSSLSLLLHPAADITQQRTVTLAGSATIDVHGNHDIPFKVFTNRLDISAKGTLFKVRDHFGEDSSSAILYRGRLEVGNGERTDTLQPMQKATIALHSSKIHVTRETIPLDSLSWHQAYFDFSRERLPASMKRIAAWYNIPRVRINAGIDTLTPGKLSEGRIGKDLTLDEFMREVEEPKLHLKLIDDNKTLEVSDKSDKDAQINKRL